MKVVASLVLGAWLVAGSAWVLTRGDGQGLRVAAAGLGLAEASEPGGDVR